MKRLLVSTTALVSIFASSAFADASKLDIKVNGLVNFEYGVRNQKAPYKQTNLTQNQKNSAFNNNARVSVSAMAQADAGFKYGAVAGLMTSANQRGGKDNSTTDNTYIFVESSLGRVEVGSNYSASKTMGITGGSVARGTGGVTGDWDSFANIDEKNDTGFYNSTSLLGDSFKVSSTNSEVTNKITYYTPQVAGFQLGVSYSPDNTVNGNTGVANVDPSKKDIKNLFNAGLTYNQTFDQITLGVSAIGSTGSVKKGTTATARKHNYQGYAFGSSLSYAGFSVSGNWGTNIKKYYTIDGANANSIGGSNVTKDVKFWSTAVAYVQGPFGVSANYYNSQSASKHKLNAWALSADYSLAPGITPYAEFVQFQGKYNKTLNVTATKNKGNVFLVGTALSF